MSVSLGVKWSEINPLPTLLPAGEYTFTLLGGKVEENGRVVVSAAVADGEATGKKFTFSYPNFSQYEWAAPQFKRLVIALGQDIADEEDPAEYLNRVAGQTFGMTVFHDEYKDQTTGENRTSVKPRLGSVKPA